MLKKFLSYIRSQNLITSTKPVLLAVSGGVDSMVMCELFRESGISHAIAHCNFKLRQIDADADEDFVRNYAEANNIPFFSKSFPALQYASENNLSIQMAARELRYNFFLELISTYSFQSAATAHHSDDSIETFLINGMRGSGVLGLTGIPVKRMNIIRPLLFCFRKEILEYAAENNIVYREDSSNHKSEYLRNKIRHIVIPSMELAAPGAKEGIVTTINNLEEVAKIYNSHIVELKRKLILSGAKGFKVKVKDLYNLPSAITFLFEWLKDYGFSRQTAISLNQTLHHSETVEFFSPGHKLIKDRNELNLIKLVDQNNYDNIKIEHPNFLVEDPLTLKGEVYNSYPEFKNEEEAYLDLDKVKFPLKLRRWNSGDYIIPLGMAGKQKISDLLVNKKVGAVEKDQVYVLEDSSGKICWVLGYKVDNRFKLDDHTKSILRLIFIRNF